MTKLATRLKYYAARLGFERPPSSDEPFRPYLPVRIDRGKLRAEVAAFFGLELAEVRRLFARYRRLHKEKNYAARFGERKTLSFEEAFVLYVSLHLHPPRSAIVEIGTQYGSSSRRILDMIEDLNLDCRLVCFDIENLVRYFTPEEAELRLEDVTDSFRKKVLEDIDPGLIFLDAHPYRLIKNVVSECARAAEPCVLAIHDCSRGLCNSRMPIPRDDPNVTSLTGFWERYALCDVFGIPDPTAAEIDALETPTHKLRIFETRHGLGVLRPRELERGRA